MSIVLISGAIASGKSTVAVAVADALSGELVRVREALAEVAGVSVVDRSALQVSGADLDRRTNGRWLVEFLERRRESHPTLVVDAIRTRRQVLPILRNFPSAVLVYLDARPETRWHRFELASATDPVKRSLSFAEAMRHRTEVDVFEVRPLANLVIETDGLTVTEVVAEILKAAARSRQQDEAE